MSGHIEGFGAHETRSVTPSTQSEDLNIIDNEEVKEKLLEILREEGDFDLLSENVRAVVAASFPGVEKEIQEFLERNQDFLEALKGGKTWSELKETSSDEEMVKWDAFRHEAKDLIEKAVCTITSEIGLPELKWAALGTPGWRSDIDNVVMTKDPGKRDEVAQALGKVLFDTLWFSTFDGMSGTQVDLETYTSQIGNREIYDKLTSDEAKSIYANVGQISTHIQMYRSMGKEQWQEYKREMREAVKSELGEEVEKSFASIFDEVERFEETVDQAICSRIEGEVDRSSEAYKLAKFSYKTSKIIVISEALERCEKGISRLQKELEKVPYSQTDLRESIMQSIEFLEVEMATYGLMRECFMDEGYISAGAFLDICKRGGGQAEARRWEQISKEMHETGIGAQVIKRSEKESSSVELVESLQENMGMGVQKCSTSGVLKAAKYSERQANASLRLLHHSTDASLKSRIKNNKQGADELLVAMRKKEITPANFEEFLREGFDMVLVCHKDVQEGMEKPWDPEKSDKASFMEQLESCLVLSDFGRNELEIKDFIEEIVGPMDEASSWEELRGTLKEVFPLFDVEEAVSGSLEILKDLKEQQHEMKATLPEQRKDLLLGRMAAKGYLTTIVEGKHLAPFYRGLEPVLTAGIGVESPKLRGLKELHRRASDRTFSKQNIKVKSHIQEQMRLSIAVSVHAMKEGLYPIPAAEKEGLLRKKYENLLH